MKRALAPLITNADSADLQVRSDARAAIVESALAFLESLIARLASERVFEAVDALRRIGTPTSRLHLKNLFYTTRDGQQSAIVLALARIGHTDDAEFFGRVLGNRDNDRTSRRYAAEALGRIGGDVAVRHLVQALSSPTRESTDAIARALGNTRSRLAVPVLIDMFGAGSDSSVCSALQTLTHRALCAGGDPATTKLLWQQWWAENGAATAIHGLENCPSSSPK